jgi:hypothetical protein
MTLIREIGNEARISVFIKQEPHTWEEGAAEITLRAARLPLALTIVSA